MAFLINLIKNNLVLFGFVVIAIILTIILALSGTFNKKLILLKTSPEEGIVYSGVPYGSIYFYFSEEINPKTIITEIIPQTEIVAEAEKSNGEFFVKIYPKTFWKFNTQYKITIKNTLSSLSGAKTDNNFIYSFSYSLPQNEKGQGIPSEEGINMNDGVSR